MKLLEEKEEKKQKEEQTIPKTKAFCVQEQSTSTDDIPTPLLGGEITHEEQQNKLQSMESMESLEYQNPPEQRITRGKVIYTPHIKSAFFPTPKTPGKKLRAKMSEITNYFFSGEKCSIKTI